MKLSSKVSNLGGIFDNKMRLTNHVKTICQKQNQPRNIGKIKKYLFESRNIGNNRALLQLDLDYSNSILCGMPHYIITPNPETIN